MDVGETIVRKHHEIRSLDCIVKVWVWTVTGSSTIDVDVAIKSNERLHYDMIRMTPKIIRKLLNTK